MGRRQGQSRSVANHKIAKAKKRNEYVYPFWIHVGSGKGWRTKIDDGLWDPD